MASRSSALDDDSPRSASTVESRSTRAWLIQKIASFLALGFGEFLAISTSIGNACDDALVATMLSVEMTTGSAILLFSRSIAIPSARSALLQIGRASCRERV